MGRKSLEAQRTEEILAAFERCILKYGIDVSLEQIADEANVKRSLIRHYIGNRDALVNQVIERITSEFMQQIEALSADIPDSELLTRTLDYLFRSDSGYDATDQIILQVLISAQDRYPLAKQSLQQVFSAFIDLLAGDFARLLPGRTAQAYQAVAYSVLCLSLANESMMWLGLNAELNAAARRQAEFLIAQLKGAVQ
jgi:AcrR family transcriptional regulator